MTRILLLSALTVLAAATNAEAGWVDGPVVAIPYNCAGQPNASLLAQVGYANDPASPLKTGDSGYVHVVAQADHCTNGAMIEVFLPSGATLDTTKPMYCLREKTDGKQEPITDCVPAGYVGPNGGLRFTQNVETLAPDWFVELQIPVIYTAELVGLAGGPSHGLGARVNSLSGFADPAVPVTVGYRASLQISGPSSVTTSSAQLEINLFSYYKAGQLVVDYGTTAALGQSTTPGQVPATGANFPSNAVIQGLAAGTTYFWRARFVTAAGTFTSLPLTFTTPVPTLSVATAGRGLGQITSNPTGLDCGAKSANVCAVSVAPGMMVTLFATPSTPAYTFTGWSGACTGTGTCRVSMDASKAVTANFELFDPSRGTPLPDPTPRR
jgi:Divergent InlB B-repeat domain